MIGIFDSGSGGLTVLSAIRTHLPSADIAYFGDTARAPYGKRSREELSRYTVEAIQFLAGKGVTNIVSACNSVSTLLAISLFETLALPPERLIEMVGPTVAAFRDSSNRVLLCATEATIASGIYQHAFQMIGKNIETVAIADLAGAIEEGANGKAIDTMIRTAFQSVRFEDFDTLVLACTHYPLVMDSFNRVLGDSVAIYDPAHAVGKRVLSQWWPKEVGNGTLMFYISKDSSPFRAHVARFFPGGGYAIEVIQ